MKPVQRAQPDAQTLPDLDLRAEPTRRRKEVEKLLLRFPPWLKPMIQEAAEREGLSMNQWCCRILVEAAKASRDNFISQPYEMEPRMGLHGRDRGHPHRAAGTVPDPIMEVPKADPWSPWYQPTGQVTTTTDNSSYQIHWAHWVHPDDDIPELT